MEPAQIAARCRYSSGEGPLQGRQLAAVHVLHEGGNCPHKIEHRIHCP